jgi:hypothetical protein
MLILIGFCQVFNRNDHFRKGLFPCTNVKSTDKCTNHTEKPLDNLSVLFSVEKMTMYKYEVSNYSV